MPTPLGTTVIVHKIRVLLALTIEQYVIMDAIHQIVIAGKRADFFAVAKLVGAPEQKVLDIVTVLALRDLILFNPDKGLLCDIAWTKHFDVDADFEEFWVLWTKKGNRRKALKKYIAARKLVDKERLHSAGLARINRASERQYIPNAETWLSAESRHWEDEQENPEEQKPAFGNGVVL